jgi:hypothetical protein
LNNESLDVYISYMSIAKSKPLARKPAKAAPAADKSRLRAIAPERAAPLVKRGRVAARREVALPERLRHALGELVTVSIADARTRMPKMIRSSATGHTFLISNARVSDAPSAVLIGLDELNRVLAEPVGTRTLGEVLATLPFSGMELTPPTAATPPGAGLPTARLPK